jgi:hypothetical protein
MCPELFDQKMLSVGKVKVAYILFSINFENVIDQFNKFERI